MPNRVAITAMGVVSALGNSPAEIRRSLKTERVCFQRPLFDPDLVIAPVEEFNLKAATGRFKEARYLNRAAQLCTAAFMAALDDSGLTGDQRRTAGLFVGTGPNLDIGGEFPDIQSGRMDRESLAALWILKFLPNTAASAIAKLAGIHGENLTVTTACAASLQAMGEAFRKIKHGDLDLAFAGGGDSRLTPGGLLAYKKAHALFTGGGDPSRACRPFDVDRSGFVTGEGGAFFLLESLDHARRRGARIYGEIRGYAGTLDGKSMTAPDPDGRWAEQAVRRALEEAGTTPEQVGVVSAHGTGTPLNDAMEAALIRRVYGPAGPRVMALKSWIGHASAGCGALETAILLSCIAHGVLPKIRNLLRPCDAHINLLKEETSWTGDTAVVENFGFGGQNSALVVSVHPPTANLSDIGVAQKI